MLRERDTRSLPSLRRISNAFLVARTLSWSSMLRRVMFWSASDLMVLMRFVWLIAWREGIVGRFESTGKWFELAKRVEILF